MVRNISELYGIAVSNIRIIKDNNPVPRILYIGAHIPFTWLADVCHRC